MTEPIIGQDRADLFPVCKTIRALPDSDKARMCVMYVYLLFLFGNVFQSGNEEFVEFLYGRYVCSLIG